MKTVVKSLAKAESGGVSLTGPRVLLRPVRAGDLPLLRIWDEDPEIIARMGRRFTIESPETWFDSLSGQHTAKVWIIEVEGLPIGEVELAQIHQPRGSAEIRICIGERSYWGKGIGTEVLTTVLEYAFTTLALQSIYLRVFGNNERALALYDRLGFRKKAMLQPSSRRHDPAPVILMELLARRWLLRVKQSS